MSSTHRLVVIARRLAWVVLGLLVVAVGAVYVITHSDWGKGKLIPRLEAAAAPYIDGELHIGHIEGSLLRGAVLRDVQVVRDGQVVLTVARVTGQYGLRRLLSSSVLVDALTLYAPKVTVTQSADGWRVEGIRIPEGDPAHPSTTTVTLPHIEVIDGEIAVRPIDRVYDLVDVDAEVSVQVSRDINVDIRRMSAVETRGGLVATALTAHVRGTTGQVVLAPFDLRTPTSRLRGALTLFEEGELEVRLNSEHVTLTEFVYYAPFLAGIALSPAIDLHLNGPLDALHVTGPLDDPTAGGATIDVVLDTTGVFSARGRAVMRRLDVAPLVLRPEWATRLTGTVQFDVHHDRAERLIGPFTSTLTRSSYAAYDIDHLWTEGALSPQGVTTAFDASAYGATSTGQLTYETATSVTTVVGRLKGGNAARLPRFLDLPPLETDVSGAYTLVAQTPRVWQLDSVLDSSTMEGAAIDSGMVANISLAGQDVTYVIKGRMTDVDPSRILPKVMDSPVEMPVQSLRISGVVDVQGSGVVDAPVTDHTARFSGTLDADVDGAVLSDVAVTGALASRRLTLTAQGTAAGTWSPGPTRETTVLSPTGSFEFALDAPDVTTPLGPTWADGRLVATLAASTLYGIDVTSASVTADAADGVVTFAPSAATGPLGKAELTGRLGLRQGAVSDLTYLVDIVDLANLPTDLGVSATGQLRTQGRVTGPYSQPVARGTALASAVTIRNVSVLSAQSTYEIQMPDFLTAQMRGRAEVAGTFIEAGGQSWPRATITATFDATTADVTAAIEHERATIAFGGRATRPADGTIEVSTDRVTVQLPGASWSMPDGETAVLRLSSERLTVAQFVLVNGNERLAFTGTLPFASQATSQGDHLAVEAADVSVAPFLTAWLGAERVTGLLNASVVVTGALDDPLVRGSFAVTQGTADLVPFRSVGGTVSMSAGVTALDITLDAGERGQASVKGTMPVDPNAVGIDMIVKAALADVGVVGPAIPYIANATGTGDADLHITGSRSSPDIDGAVTLARVRFESPETGVFFANLTAALQVEKSTLVVEQLSVQDEDGHLLRVSGRLDVLRRASAGDVDLRIVAQDFKLLANQFGELRVDLDLTGSGTLTAPELIGTVNVDQGRFQIDQLLQQFLPSTAYESTSPFSAPVVPVVGTDPHPAPMPPSVLSDAALTIDVTLPDNVLVRGRALQTEDGPIGLGDVNLTLGGTLQVIKARGEQPALLGEVAVVRGSYDFQGTRFAIERGSRLRFRGDDYTNPSLDITALREVSGVEVRARITGTAAMPSLTLSSVPSLDQGDLLAMVVFNRPINQLGSGERVALAARAGSLAAGAVTGPIADSVARALDLDVFDIQTTELGLGGATVTVGRQIGDRLFVGFRHEFGGEGTDRLTFEYRLNKFLRLVTSIAPGGQPANRTARTDTDGIDLIFVIKR